MGVLLSKLVKQISYMDFKLVAGEKGLSNEVRWIHMVDSDTISAFLQGQELVFTTGIGLNDELTLFELVKEVYKKKASGIVINIGPYIEEITQEIIDFANDNDFPVFETPWETRMADIMHIFSFSINKAEQEKMELAVTVNNAFNLPLQKEMYIPFFNKKGFLSDWNYAVCCLKIVGNKKNVSSIRYDRIGTRMDNIIQYLNYDKVLCAAMENYIVIIFADVMCKKKTELSRKIVEELKGSLTSDEIMYVAIGKTIDSLCHINESYKYAFEMIDMMVKGNIYGQQKDEKTMMCTFENLGMLKLLLSLEKQDVMIEYTEETVEPLFKHDQLNDGDLVEVLESYLLHNGSLKEVSEELNIHRNTVNYKLKKIEDILGVDLSNLYTRFELMLGLQVKKIL